MKTLLKALVAGLFMAAMAVSQAHAAADAPVTPAPGYGWYYLDSGWYLMVPADANQASPAAATTNGQGFTHPVAVPAGVAPAGARIIAVGAPTIHVHINAEPAATATSDNAASNDEEPETGNNSGSGSLDSMR